MSEVPGRPINHAGPRRSIKGARLVLRANVHIAGERVDPERPLASHLRRLLCGMSAPPHVTTNPPSPFSSHRTETRADERAHCGSRSPPPSSMMSRVRRESPSACSRPRRDVAVSPPPARHAARSAALAPASAARRETAPSRGPTPPAPPRARPARIPVQLGGNLLCVGLIALTPPRPACSPTRVWRWWWFPFLCVCSRPRPECGAVPSLLWCAVCCPPAPALARGHGRCA